MKGETGVAARRTAARGAARLALSIVLGAGLGAGCATAPVEEEVPSAESYYERGLETLEGRRVLLFFDDIDYPKAIEYFQEVIDNYPYSQFSTLAELKIADIHFQRENFEEAASYYQDFVELHPKHEQVPYAIYRNGLCSFKQMREADRDQAPTRQAIEQFSALIERYGDSDAAEDARARRQEALDQLAAHDVAIADFYFERNDFHAAIRRYRDALAQYPQDQNRPRIMARLGTALKRLHRYGEAERLYQQVLLRDELPDDLVDEVREELAGIPKLQGDRGPLLPRSCATDPNPACLDQ